MKEWVGPRAGLDIVGKKKSFPFRNETLIFQPVVILLPEGTEENDEEYQ
jgi:hypothetical protein